MDYAKLIKELRNKFLLSQTDFTELLQASFETVNRWENGKNEPAMKYKKSYQLYLIKMKSRLQSMNSYICDCDNLPRYFYQNIHILNEVYLQTGKSRGLRRERVLENFVNGLNKGVLVNYHFSLIEINEHDISKSLAEGVE